MKEKKKERELDRWGREGKGGREERREGEGRNAARAGEGGAGRLKWRCGGTDGAHTGSRSATFWSV